MHGAGLAKCSELAGPFGGDRGEEADAAVCSLVQDPPGVEAAVQAARDAIGLTFTYVDAFQVEAERLTQQTMTDAAFDALIDATFGNAEATATKRVPETERRRSRLHWLFTDANTKTGNRETAWAGYQSVADCGRLSAARLTVTRVQVGSVVGRNITD